MLLMNYYRKKMERNYYKKIINREWKHIFMIIQKYFI